MSDRFGDGTNHSPEAGLLAQIAIKESALSQPYGGPDWPQKSGYEIQHEIYRSTESAIARVLEKQGDPA